MKHLLFAVALTCAAGEPARAYDAAGIASWYDEGTRTACGGRFDPEALTAAHRTLPCGALVTVTHERTGHTVTVRITDRGPARWTGRLIDLSRGAARRLDILRAGVAPVRISTEHPQ